MKGFRITRNDDGDYDMLMENGKFVWAEDGTHVAQRVTHRLLTFKGDLSLNGVLTGKDDEGTDWFGIIFNAAKSNAEKDFELKRVILGTPGVTGIKTWNWTLEGHTLNIVSEAITDWGVIDISQEITPL